MPWLAVPYPDEARRSRLNRLYGIQGISQPLPPSGLDAESGVFFLSSLVMSHTLKGGRDGWQLSVPGRQTATQIALQPEECGPVIKFTVLPRKCCLSLASLGSSLSLLLIPSSCVCRGLWRKLARAGSLWPLLQTMWGMHGATSRRCPPSCSQTHADHVVGPPPLLTSLHMRPQENTHSHRCLFMIRLLIREGDCNQKDRWDQMTCEKEKKKWERQQWEQTRGGERWKLPKMQKEVKKCQKSSSQQRKRRWERELAASWGDN